MRLIGLILLLLTTATCGQEGPLYLPEESSRATGWHAAHAERNPASYPR